MRFLDPNGLVSLIGLLAQTGVAWILALIFALLLKPSGRPGFFVDWTRGLLCLAVGLTAVAIRYYAPLLVASWQEAFSDAGVATRAHLLVYQACKCLATMFFLRGAVRFARGEQAGQPLRWLFPAAGAYAVVTALPSSSVETVLFWQSLIYVPTLLIAGSVLWRIPRERRDQGVRITAATLQIMAGLWAAYGALTISHLAGMVLVTQRGSIPHVILSHNSYFDLALLVALAAGMIVLLMLDLQCTSRAAQEERARLELQLERGERLRSLGSLVSTVAHDLNNPLTAVLGFASELEASRAGTADEQAARIVREQAERCRSIIQRLSSLVGGHPAQRRLVDPAELIERVASGLRPKLKEHGVELKLAVAENLPALYADSYGLEEVLDNLLDNALQFSTRGDLICVTACGERDSLLIRVRDQGPGVPDSLRARIFEPFFSLRRGAHSTGLGLSVARGIVRAHAGSLEVEESDGLPGASFVLRLPATLDLHLPQDLAAVDRAPDVEAVEGGSRKALVIDDERLVREVLCRWLQREGWQTEEAGDGAEALERLRAAPEDFALVLCDLRMPNMNGYALHDRLEQELPDVLLRTLYITGDLTSQEAAAFSRRCGRPIVRKPFEFAELRAAIAEIEAQAAPSGWSKAAIALALLALSLPLAGCSREDPEPEPSIRAQRAAPPTALPDAPALYAQHCALCHGPAGDGDGSLTLDRPARSFKQGGFSFGNTEEAIFRTVSSGIGGTPMPGFAHLLSEAERRAVARHVIGLGPEQVPGPGFASILSVGDRPVVVRGQFAPLVEGGPEFPRGLLIGNPDGLSYQYSADDLRLLAVRQGPFVDRKDWGERGGLPLEPLGRVIWLADPGGALASEWKGYPTYDLRSVLRGTSTAGAQAELRYDLVFGDGRVLASVEESCRALTLAAGSGFLREFRMTPSDELVRHRDDTGNTWRLVRIGAQACAIRARRTETLAIEYVLLEEPAEASFQRLVAEAR